VVSLASDPALLGKHHSRERPGVPRSIQAAIRPNPTVFTRTLPLANHIPNIIR
jgi:hypothetical protein